MAWPWASLVQRARSQGYDVHVRLLVQHIVILGSFRAAAGRYKPVTAPSSTPSAIVAIPAVKRSRSTPSTPATSTTTSSAPTHTPTATISAVSSMMYAASASSACLVFGLLLLDNVDNLVRYPKVFYLPCNQSSCASDSSSIRTVLPRT